MYARVVYFALFLGTLSLANGARVLVLFAHPGRSHHMAFQPLLIKLAERGNDVTVVSFFPLQKPMANYTDVSLIGMIPSSGGIEVWNVEHAGKNAWTYAKFFGFNGIHDQIFIFDELRDTVLDICGRLVRYEPLLEVLKKDYDVVLLETFSSDCMLGLTHAYGITAPVVGLSSGTLLPWAAERLGMFDNPSYQSMITTPFSRPTTFLQRLENIFLSIYYSQYYAELQAREQEIIEKSVGRKIENLQSLALKTPMIISNTFHSLNGRRLLVPGLIEAGGMHLSEKLRDIPRYMEDFLNASEEGVILFSWGSQIKTSTIPPEKEELIVNALSRLPQRVLWKYENSGPEGNLTGNILRVKWIPQYELLKHKKVVAYIAHGGLLGMTEAISAGKPMVVVPFLADQPYNGATAADAGLGVVLPYHEMTEEKLYKALTTVLSPEFRKNAHQASQIWNDRPLKPLDTAVYWIERVARWGYAAPLHLPARDMPFYQRAMLDVIGAAVLALIAVLLVIRLLLKIIFKAIRSLFASEKKKKVH